MMGSMPNNHDTQAGPIPIPTSDHDIAIVGFSLKLPGEATSPEKFWDMLLAGRTAASEFPADRLNLDGHYHPDKSRLDQMPLRGGYFLRDKIDRFDAPFFSISPAEAACMEPQQRHMLETCYRALENAGITISQCSGTRTSVHTGSFTDDYRSVMFHDRLEGHMYAATGLANSILANRISWFFNMTGPSLNLDTACSSSISALHLACQDLRNGTTDMGLVGGCNLIYHPDYMLMMSNMSFLSTDSRSWSLDEKANGYARGEGFGVLVVKRLCDAVRDGDTVRAVIRATRLNQDGRTPGLTNPSGEAHKALIREAYAGANIDMKPTRFFEAHATGTQAGDPTEANAVGEVFSSVRSASDPLWIGAVKSNVGHLEAGSGMASLFKAILVLEKGIIPPNACFEKLNPRIQAERFHMRIPTEARPWPSPGLRRICVNSFGFGGSNGVVILDDAHHYPRSRGFTVPNRTKPSPPTQEEVDVVQSGITNGKALGTAPRRHPGSSNRSQGVLVWSSSDEDGLRRIQAGLSDFFSHHSDESLTRDDLKDITYTLGGRRTQLSWRRFVVFSGLSDLQEKLMSMNNINTPGSSASSPSTLVKTTTRKSTQGRRLALVLTGQGAQYAGMGRGLMASHRVFRESMERNQALLDGMGCEWRLEDVLFALDSPEAKRISEPQYSQPACTALQISLVDLLWSFGIQPSAVVGHSSGEIAAAYATGALDRESALRIAFHRGRLAAQLRRTTDCELAMMAVGLGASATETYLARLDEHFAGGRRVDMACINSPNNVTLSGDAEQMRFLGDVLREEGVFARTLNIDMAYHSRFMAPVAREYRDSLRGLLCSDSRRSSSSSATTTVVMISSVTGTVASRSDLIAPEYWVQNMTSTVRFSDAVLQLAAHTGRKRKVLGQKASRNSSSNLGISDMIEVGPHHALRGPVRECLQAAGKADTIQYHATLTRPRPPPPPPPPSPPTHEQQQEPEEPSAPADMMTVSGTLWALGYPVDLPAVGDDHLPGDPPRALRVDLPEYPFNHGQAHWRESRVARNYRLRDTPRHDFLGVRSDDWNEKQAHWRDMVGEARLPWLRDHRLAGAYLYPAGGMITMAVEAARQLAGGKTDPSSFELRDVRFLNAFRSLKAHGHGDGEGGGVETRFTLVPVPENPLWSRFDLFIYEETGWIDVCRGQIRTHYDDDDSEEDTDHLQPWQDSLFSQGECATEHDDTSQRFDTKTFYDLVAADNDAAYGPAFQTLDNIICMSDSDSSPTTGSNSSSRVTADIHTRQWARCYGDEHVSPHVVHPATVDGLLQLVFPALLGTGDTVVPTRVGRLWINARGLSRLARGGGAEDLDTVRAQGVCGRRGYRGTNVRARVVSSCTAEQDGTEEEEPLLDMEDYEATVVAARSAGAGASSSSDVEPRRLCATMQWRRDVDAMVVMDHHDEGLVRRTFSSKDSISSLEAVAARSDFYADLELVIRWYLSDALERHEEEGDEEEDVGDEQRGGLGSSSHGRNILRWARYQISRGLDGNDARSLRQEQMRQDTSFRKAMIDRVSISGDPEGMVLTKLAQNISNLIHGRVSAEELLVADDGESSVMLMHDYQKTVVLGSPYLLASLTEYLDLLGHKNPHMRILEIHAGTGVLTRVVTSALLQEGRPRWSGYHCTTNSSTDGLQVLREQFEQEAAFSSQMEFRTLDAGAGDAVKQGFEESSYDLVVACGVFDRFDDAEKMVQNVSSLLKPDGKFILLETTNPEAIRAGLYGTVTKPWRDDIHIRDQKEKYSPALSTDSWTSILQRSGFRSSLDLVLQDSTDPRVTENSLMIASKAPPQHHVHHTGPQDAPLIRYNTTVLVDNRVPKQTSLARALQDQFLGESQSGDGSSSFGACTCVDIQSIQPGSSSQSESLTNAHCISLLEIDRPFLARLQEHEFETLKQIVSSASSILWVSQDSTSLPARPEFGMVDGFARVIRGEYPMLRLVTLALEPPQTEVKAPDYCSRRLLLVTIRHVWQRMLEADCSGSTGPKELEWEYRQRNGQLEIPRVIHSVRTNKMIAARSKQRHVTEHCRLGDAPPLALRIDSPGGALDSACFFHETETEATTTLAEDEVLVRAHAVALDRRDYLIATGRVDDEQDGDGRLGMQWSGAVVEAGPASGLRPGDRVCVLGLGPGGGFQTLGRYPSSAVARIPSLSISYAAASLLPVASVAALHALTSLGDLQPGETVLVHDAASGSATGQVVIQVAQSMGARVLVTGGSSGRTRRQREREMLAGMYKIPEECVLLSGAGGGGGRRRRVLDVTGAEGVDVVVALSPSADEAEQLWDCVASLGRYIHVTDGQEAGEFGRTSGGRRTANVTFSRLNVARLLRGRPAHAAKLWKRAAEMLQSGTIYPVAGMQVHGPGDMKAALEFYASGQEGGIGGSVVELSNEDVVKANLVVRPLYSFDGDSTYVISGGLGGIGRSIARWMVARGARHLLLLSRSGTSRPTAKALVDELTQQKAQVLAPPCDITDIHQLNTVVEEACKLMPPIKGCIQGAMVLRDTIFENMSWDDWSESVNAKVLGSWNLHLAMPPGLDFFTLLSSISCILGGVSQSNYAAGNAYMNALCRYRRATTPTTGERASNTSAVNLGMLVTEGVVSESEELLAVMRGMGNFMEIQGDEMFALLEQHLQPSPPPPDDVGADDDDDDKDHEMEDAQPIMGIQLPAAMEAAGKELPDYLTAPTFRHFRYPAEANNNTQDSSSHEGSKATSSDRVDFASVIGRAETTAHEVATHMVGWLAAKMAKVLGLDVTDIDPARPISSYGIDSLIGMDVRNWFERELGAKMAIFELLSASTSIADVCASAAAKSRFRSEQNSG